MKTLWWVVFTFPWCALIAGSRFEVRDLGQRDLVHFESQAPLARIVGVNTAIHGWIETDVKNIRKAFKGNFEVDARAFQTGLELRDSQLRDNFLRTRSHPYAKLEIDSLARSSSRVLRDGKLVAVTLSGTLSLNGVNRKIKIPATLVYFKESAKTLQRIGGNLLRVQAEFPIELSDFHIKWNKQMSMLLAQRVKVKVALTATDGNLPYTYHLDVGKTPGDIKEKTEKPN